MAVSFSDLQLAFEFVSSGGMGENEAYLDRRSGKIYWHSEVGDNDEELPDDIDEEKYISIPDKRELDLGKPLVLDFAREFLPDDYDEVRHIFSRKGAYRQYKELLVRFFEQVRGDGFAGVVRGERDRNQRDLRSRSCYLPAALTSAGYAGTSPTTCSVVH
jgi:hypothetical protein